MKKYLVADILHYPIPYTEIERAVIATPIFNRLHSVKQNSTSYLTYPSLGHSRFSHSLGAMHLAGQLFTYAMSNASDMHRKRFLKSVRSTLEKVAANFKADEFPSLINFEFKLKDRAPSELLEYAPVLGESIPHSLTKTEQFCYLITLQAIRLCALTHDLGHPPFSHVTEDAITSIRAGLPPKASRNERQHECALAFESRQKNGDSRKPLHEQLTEDLFAELVSDVRRTTIGMLKEGPLASCWLATEFACLIFGKEHIAKWGVNNPHEISTVKALYELFSSDFDCDRLDYVQRDLMLSGIRTDAFRPQRLIQLFELFYENKDADSPPLFLPHIRAIRSLEEFFSARYDLYKNVLFHHHVVRTNGLLRDIIINLATQWLTKKTSGETNSTTKTHILSNNANDIAWLWNVFARRDHTTHDIRHDIYLQWDDHWLMSLLRAQYVELHRKTEKQRGRLKQDVLFRQLEDLVASKKNYVSLIKRSEDFLDIDHSFAKHLLADFTPAEIEQNINEAVQRVLNSSPEQEKRKRVEDCVLPFISILKKYHSSKDDQDSHGIVDAANVLLAGAWLIHLKHRSLQDAVREDFMKGRSLRDVIFTDMTRRSQAIGFNETFKIRTTRGVSLFSEYSNLARELLARAKSYPGFLAFILLRPGVTVKKTQLREALGALLAKEFFKVQQRLLGEKT